MLMILSMLFFGSEILIEIFYCVVVFEVGCGLEEFG